MPILGTLSEFPLPEVMLLIGNRTGRLCLYDVPRYGHMEIDITEGRVHMLRLDDRPVDEIGQIVEQLCFVVELAAGMFEFHSEATPTPATRSLMQLEELVMRLVVEVDKTVARRREALSTQAAFVLNLPAPEIWLDPSMDEFLARSKPYLETGIGAGPLAELLGQDEASVRFSLSALCDLGFVRREADFDGELASVSDTSNHQQLVKDISALSKRTAKLLEVWPRASEGPDLDALTANVATQVAA